MNELKIIYYIIPICHKDVYQRDTSIPTHHSLYYDVLK